MHCPSCQHENPAEANFCLHCGTQLARVCPHCQHVLPPEARFCMACGQPLTEQQSLRTLDARRQTLDSPAERRQ